MMIVEIRINVLDEGNPYETLLALIGKSITPFFKSAAREAAKGERDGDKLVPAVEKSLNEAEVFVGYGRNQNFFL